MCLPRIGTSRILKVRPIHWCPFWGWVGVALWSFSYWFWPGWSTVRTPIISKLFRFHRLKPPFGLRSSFRSTISRPKTNSSNCSINFHRIPIHWWVPLEASYQTGWSLLACWLGRPPPDSFWLKLTEWCTNNITFRSFSIWQAPFWWCTFLFASIPGKNSEDWSVRDWKNST